MSKIHLVYVRDGGPLACDCTINHDHDQDALTVETAQFRVDDIISKFYRDLAYVAPELYEERFAYLASQIKSIIRQVG